MQISRDLTRRPGVGTLMYMGDDPAPSSPALPQIPAIPPIVTAGAAAAVYWGRGLLRWAGIGILGVQAYRTLKR